MPILKAFTDFKDEAALVGRMLAGYADLELDLMYCVKAVKSDFDTVFKAMFRVRGETQRIDLADAFGRQSYHDLGIGTQFEMAIGSVRYCLRIRNQYAHSQWWDDNSGQLAFANLEEIAKENTLIENLDSLTARHVDLSVLGNQLSYYEYTDNLLIWVLQEGNIRAGRPAAQGLNCPTQLTQPALHVPLPED